MGCTLDLGNEPAAADDVFLDEKGSGADKAYRGDLGGALGTPVVAGTTLGSSKDFTATCVEDSSAKDVSYTWTAPWSSTFVFDSMGSAFDTVLEIRRPDDLVSLGCNNDSDGTPQSRVTLSLSAGQTVLIVLDGHFTDWGEYQLNIEDANAPTCVDLLPTADADVWSKPDMVHVNRGSNPHLQASAWTYVGVKGVFRIFLDFDLDQIPASAQLESATLHLFACPTCSPGHSSLSGPNEGTVHIVTEPWQEDTITWYDQPSISSTRAATPQSTHPLQDYQIDVTGAVGEMRDDPAGSFGLAVKLRSENQYRALMFQSREFADPARRPKLRVCYTQ